MAEARGSKSMLRPDDEEGPRLLNASALPYKIRASAYSRVLALGFLLLLGAPRPVEHVVAVPEVTLERLLGQAKLLPGVIHEDVRVGLE
jgi:hypothetical protein